MSKKPNVITEAICNFVVKCADITKEDIRHCYISLMNKFLNIFRIKQSIKNNIIVVVGTVLKMFLKMLKFIVLVCFFIFICLPIFILSIPFVMPVLLLKDFMQTSYYNAIKKYLKGLKFNLESQDNE